MKYRNVKTGDVIDVPSQIISKNWEEVTPPKTAKKEAEAETKAEPAKKKTTKKGK